MSYNVQIIEYPLGYQAKIYSKVVGLNTYKPIDPPTPVYDSNGFLIRVIPPEPGFRAPSERMFNPFYNPETDKISDMYCRYIVDVEHSRISSFNRTKRNLYYDVRSNIWEYFITFTFSKDVVDRYNWDDVSKKMSQWLSNMRRICPEMRYVVVPEQHKDGAYHFHGVFSGIDGFNLVDSGHKTKDDQVIYNVDKYKFGFTTATAVKDSVRCAKYICKYITKDLCKSLPGKKRYWKSKNLAQAEKKEYTLTEQHLDEIKEELHKKALHSKTVESFDFNVTYFELKEGFVMKTVKEVLEPLNLTDYSHIVVQSYTHDRVLVPIGGGSPSKILRLYGHLPFQSSSIRDGILYLTIM